MTLSFTIGFSPSLKRFIAGGSKRKILGAGTKAMEKVAKEAEKFVKAEAPKKSGLIRKSVKARSLKTRIGFRVGVLKKDVPYIGWVVDGHPDLDTKGQIEVTPKRGNRALRFYWRKLKKFVILKKVIWGNPDYPTGLLPIKPNNFVLRGVKNNFKSLTKTFHSAFKKEFIKIQ